MKILSRVASLTVAFTLSAVAQLPSTQGTIILSDGSIHSGFVVGSTRTNVFYLKNKNDDKPESVRRSQVESIYLMEPSDYTEAMELFQDRKYSEAAKRFEEVQKKYKKLELIPDNFHHLAGYYKLECLRKQLDVPALVKEVTSFGTPDLTKPYQRKQIEAYAFWEAVNAKAWGRLIRMAEGWQAKRLPASIRVQVAYCHGLALENEGRAKEALLAYAVAMTADYTQSEVLVRNAAINSLRVYESLPSVKRGLEEKLVNDPDLKSAGALAALYERAGFGAGAPLPAEYKVFLEYAPAVIVPAEKEEVVKADLPKDSSAKEEPAKEEPVVAPKTAAQKKKEVAAKRAAARKAAAAKKAAAKKDK